MQKDFLCLSDWSREELEQIFALTKELKAKQQAGQPHASQHEVPQPVQLSQQVRFRDQGDGPEAAILVQPDRDEPCPPRGVVQRSELEDALAAPAQSPRREGSVQHGQSQVGNGLAGQTD